MTDLELTALIALVNQETQERGDANRNRFDQGFAPAYNGYEDKWLVLEEELRRRGVLK